MICSLDSIMHLGFLSIILVNYRVHHANLIGNPPVFKDERTNDLTYAYSILHHQQTI